MLSKRTAEYYTLFAIYLKTEKSLRILLTCDTVHLLKTATSLMTHKGRAPQDERRQQHLTYKSKEQTG